MRSSSPPPPEPRHDCSPRHRPATADLLGRAETGRRRHGHPARARGRVARAAARPERISRAETGPTFRHRRLVRLAEMGALAAAGWRPGPPGVAGSRRRRHHSTAATTSSSTPSSTTSRLHLGVRFTPLDAADHPLAGSVRPVPAAPPATGSTPSTPRSRPGLHLAGSSYRGIGIPACIRDGRMIARRANAQVTSLRD